jgi:hypothetical protein
MSPFDDPAITAESILGLDASASDPRLDAPSSTATAATRVVIPFIGVQFGGPATGTTPRTRDRWNAVEQSVQDPGVVDVGWGQQHGQRNALSIDKKMAFRAWFAFIRWVGAGFFAPFFAATVAESTAARLQSISPARPNSSKRSRWRRSQTPACCHSWSRRQQVIPLPQPISRGRISQGMPLRRTNRIPVKVARSARRGRPPLGLAFSGGSSGAIRSHSASLRSGRISRLRITKVPEFC